LPREYFQTLEYGHSSIARELLRLFLNRTGKGVKSPVDNRRGKALWVLCRNHSKTLALGDIDAD
jgi:hypothetical protein